MVRNDYVWFICIVDIYFYARLTTFIKNWGKAHRTTEV